MKKIVKITGIVILLISILSGCALHGEKNTSISSENINKHLIALTSPEFEGRLMGTKGNEKTIEYIKNHFEDIGLVPVEGDSFTQAFDGLNISYNGKPIFNVMDKDGKVIASYKEGLDYKVRLDNSSIPGSFSGGMQYIDDKKKILKNEYNYDNLAILLDYNNKSIQETYLTESQIDDRIYYKYAKVLIYPESNSISKKDIQLGTKNSWGINTGIMKLGMDPEVYKTLVNYCEQGYKLDIDIPITFNEIKSTNVLGMINGRIKDYNSIIIATSFDGLGIDSMGNIYPGAADNASATALFLELSRILKEETKQIDSNIIFLALNGNKLGDRGFDNFFRVNGVSSVRSQVIYLDKVGTMNGELLVGTFTNPSLEYKKNMVIFNEILNTIKDIDVNFKYQDDYSNSDYINFRFNGIIASVLTNGDNLNIGTHNDTIDNVNLAKVVEVGDIVLNNINGYGNTNILKEILELFKSIWWLLLIGILLIYVKFVYIGKIKSLDYTGHDRVWRYIKEKPIVSIYFIFMIFAIMLILQAKHDILLSEGLLMQDIKVGFMDVIYASIKNILSTGPMVAFISIFMVPLLLILLGSRLLTEKIKLPKQLYLLIVAIASYLVILFGLGMFYRYEYAIIFPKLLSLPKANLVVILVIEIYSFLIIYFMNKEMKDFSKFKLIIAFIIMFLVIVSATYSPYLFNKTIINLRNTGGKIRL